MIQDMDEKGPAYYAKGAVAAVVYVVWWVIVGAVALTLLVALGATLFG